MADPKFTIVIEDSFSDTVKDPGVSAREERQQEQQPLFAPLPPPSLNRQWQDQLEKSARDPTSRAEFDRHLKDLWAKRPEVRGPQAEGSFDGQAGEAAMGEEAAGGAEAAAGAEMAGAAALGPAGAIVLAANEATKKLISSFRTMREGVEGTSRGLQNLAGNDNDAALRRVGDGLAETEKKFGKIGEVVAEETKLLLAFGRATLDVTESLTMRGREISQFSSPLATAGAMADVRTLLMDIKEAQTTGPELAKLTTAESEMNVALRDALLPIKKVLAEILTPIMSKIAFALEKYGHYGEDIAKFLEGAFDWFSGVLEKIATHIPGIGDDVKAFLKEWRDKEKNRDVNDQRAWEMWLKAIRRGNPNAGIADMDRNEIDPGILGIPVVQGFTQ